MFGRSSRTATDRSCLHATSLRLPLLVVAQGLKIFRYSIGGWPGGSLPSGHFLLPTAGGQAPRPRFGRRFPVVTSAALRGAAEEIGPACRAAGSAFDRPATWEEVFHADHLELDRKRAAGWRTTRRPTRPGHCRHAVQLSPFLMIAVLFYLLMIRPERRKRAELTAMLQNLKKNDRVVTIGGIYGTVVNAQKDLDEVTIKVDESTNTKLRMQRSAIARVLRLRQCRAAED